jgi:CheY-like chemotaxis protein
MLDYAGKNRVLRQPLDLNQLITENLPLLRAGLSKDLSIEPILARDLPLVPVDPGQIQQIVMNLILNAADAMAESAGTIQVLTGVEVDPETRSAQDRTLPPGAYVYLEVVDQGCGMPPDVMARIFDPFFTTKATGRGLGLSAVQGIVQAHQGDIRIQTAPGQGTRFRVFLPVNAGEISPAPAASPAIPKRSATVLVIDDELHSRDVAVQVLKQAGYTALAAAEGREGVDLFQAHQNQISLVLLDMVMPGLSGVEILRNLRQIRHDAKVLLVSGHAKDVALARFQEREITGFLQKPYKVQALLEAVGTALGAGDLGAEPPHEADK